MYTVADIGPHVVQVVVTELRCMKCKHQWQKRRKTLPAVCPSCKSHSWDKPSTRVPKEQHA